MRSAAAAGSLDSPAAARDACRKRRFAPLDYLFGKRWFVLRSCQLDPENVLSLQLDCAAFILDISVDDMGRVDSFFEGLTAALEAQAGQVQMPPCVAVLSSARAAPTLTGSVHEEGCDQLLLAQGRLHDLGLDEVVLKGVSAAETHVSLLMALRRLEHSRHAWDVWESDREKERAKWTKMVKEQEKTLRQQWAEEMWSFATFASEVDITRVLPPVDESLPSKVDIGASIGELRVESVLGRGGFGTVCLAHNSDTCEAEALKLFPKRQHSSLEKIISVASEVDAMRAMRHENVVALLGVIHTKRHIIVRMQYVGSLTVMKYLRESEGCRVPLARARDLFRQLVAGIAYCHSRDIAHCDIKPENLGLDAGGRHLKVLDFGCAAKVDAVVEAPKGTMPFMAPEVLLSCAGRGYAPASADVWAMGVVLLEMAAGVGSVNQLMGWPLNVEVCPRSAENALSVLSGGAGPIRNLVHRYCGPPPLELSGLLDASFALKPGARPSAARLAMMPWVSRPTQPKSEGAIRAPPRAALAHASASSSREATQHLSVESARAAPHRSAESATAPPPRPTGRGPRPSSSVIRRRANFVQDLLASAEQPSS